MTRQYIQLLKELGLSDNEALVYCTALNLGPTTILQLSRLMDIKRSTLYLIVDSLAKQGLFNIQIKGTKKYYAAENPTKLEIIFENKRRMLNQVLPELLTMFNQISEKDSFIKLYEGLEGIKSIYDQLLGELNPGDFYLVISDTNKWYHLDKDYFETYKQKRAKLDLDIKLLLQDTEFAHDYKDQEKQYHVNIKFLPQQKLLNTTMVVVPHKVVIVETKPPLSATVIENKSYVHMNRVLFDVIWDSV